jgi:hypothetical protein
MKKGKKEDGDKNKKKGWGARLMSLIAGSSDEELAPSDDDQDEMPRGKGGSGGGAAAAVRIVQAEAPAIDSRAALKKMLKDPDQKKVKHEVCLSLVSAVTSLSSRRCTNLLSTWV